MRRNHPRYPGTDPNKFQGAFLRIFNRDSIGNNTLTANNGGMLANAYDVGEDPNNQVGYFGKYNIPDTSLVAGGGLHEMILSGNRLYLAGYNNGARVFDLRGSTMKLLGYCRTERYLSNDTSSSDFYLRPDIYMYAKGPYRLIPDPSKNDVLFANDLYNGVWIYKFYDSTLADTIRHIAFQDTLIIGPVSPSTKSFTLTNTVIIHKDAALKIDDNTSLVFNSGTQINVNGYLELGSVYLDSSDGTQRSKIICTPGGTLVLGGPGKIISGINIIVIDSGATATIKAGSTMNTIIGSQFIVNGTLTIESSTLNGPSSILCQRGGTVKIQSNSEITGLYKIDIEDGGNLVVGNQSVTKMAQGGRVTISGCRDTDIGPNGWARFQSTFSPLDSVPPTQYRWQGIQIDSMSDCNYSLVRLQVYHANVGIETTNAFPQITECLISRNLLGIATYGSSPFIYGNTITHNSQVGVWGNYMTNTVGSNTIDSNQLGVSIYYSTNNWFNNKIDFNNYGLDAAEAVAANFNLFVTPPTPPTCDTTQGNGIRHNAYNGVTVQRNSYLLFACDNSVHSNTGSSGTYYDFVLADSSSVDGTASYPDPALLRIQQCAGCSWTWDPTYPPSDPVLYKGNSSQGIRFGYPSSDARYVAAMHSAWDTHRQGLYSFAAQQYANALHHCESRAEVLQCLLFWQKMLFDAEHIPDKNLRVWALSAGREDYLRETATASSQWTNAWLRNSIKRALAAEYMRENNNTAALQLLTELSSLTNDDSTMAKRALMALVVLEHHGFGDYDAALAIHNRIESLYPGSSELRFAKIDLGMPFSWDDYDNVFPPDTLQRQKTNENFSAISGFVLHALYPNPVKGILSVNYDLQEIRDLFFEVYNSDGSLVRSERTHPERIGLGVKTINIFGLPSGKYVLQVSTLPDDRGHKETMSKGFVVVR